MTFDEAAVILRSWSGQPVVVVLQPEGSVMEGPLQEIDAAGIDGALFAVSPSGVAVALFRDAFASGEVDAAGVVHVRQGRVEITVRRQGGTEAPAPAR
jgi:hypothetical protein